MIYIPKWRHVRRRGSILCAITQHGWKEISSMKRTTKKTLFVFVLIAAMMLSIFPAAAFAEGAAAVDPAAQTEQQPEKDAAPAANDDGAKPAEPAKGDGAKPAEPVKDGENKAEPVKNDEKSVVVEGKDGEKPADPELKDGEEKGEPEEKDDDKKEATLVFDPNAGTNIVNNMPVPNPMTGTPEEGKQNVSFTIPTTPPTRDNFEFQGWNTAADNTGTSYQPGNNIDVSVGTTGTLYAIWGDKSPETDKDYAHLVYDGNGGTDTVTNVPDSVTSDAGNVGTNHEFTVSDAVPVREGYTFKGWKDDSGKDYKAGNTIEVPAGTTTILYAQWATGMNTTLVYDANLGTGAPDAESKDVAGGTDGEFIVSDVEPTRYGYKFVGWTENSDGSGQKYKNPDTIKIPAGQTKTIYAQWELELTQMEVPVKLQVIFNGIDSLPTDFAYSVTGADGNVALKGTLTKAGEVAGGTSHMYYYVTDGPVTLDVDRDYTFTFTQRGYQVDGYTWSGNVTETLTGKVLPENRENGLVLTIVNNYTKEEVTPVDWGKLGISKSVSPTGPVKPGTTLTYTITVTNNTGADLDSVVVYDKLDRHLTFVSATGAGSYSTRTCFWTVAPLANGDSATLVIKATVNAGTADKTVIYNTASVLAASAGNEGLKVGSGPSASANVAVTNPGSGTWGGTTWGKGVQTGDDANLGLWIAAMIVSFLCVAALVYVNRKRIFKGKANNK